MMLQGTLETASGYGPPGGAPPGGYGPPGGAPPGDYGPPGGYGPPGDAPPGGYGPPGGAPPGGYGPPGGAPPGGYGPPAAPAPKKGKTGLVIGLVVVGLIVAGGVVAAIMLLGGGSSSVAHEHLPAGCDAVVRIDLEGIREVESIKEHVVPALDDAAKESEDAGKMTKFFLTAGLDPRKDLTEAAICVVDLGGGEPEVVAIVGGKMRPGGVVEALEKHEDDLEDFAIEKVSEKDGRRVIETKEGIFITQADDGALLLSNDEDLLEKALETSKAYSDDYELPVDKQLSAIITKNAMQDVGKQAGAMPFGEKLSDAGGASVTVDLEDRKGVVELAMGDSGDAKELARALNEFADMMKKAPVGVDKETKTLLEAAEIEADGEKVSVTLDIPKDLIEDAAKEIAKGIEKAND